MEYERNLNVLIRRRIIYRRDPINDEPTEVYDWGNYYKDGTYECYTLFASKAKITTYKSLKWHLYVLWYLNPQLDPDSFFNLTKLLCKKSTGFLTFTVSTRLQEAIAYEVSMEDLEFAPPNKLRKVIFKEFCGLTTKEKLQIVGRLVGKKSITESEIYDAMLLLHDLKLKITVNSLAAYLECSERTIYRNISNELKKEKLLLNQEL